MGRKGRADKYKGFWQKGGQGLKYKGRYEDDDHGGRYMILEAVDSNGEIHTLTAESWQMLKTAGWVYKHR